MARSEVTTERLWEERLRRFELGGSSVAAFCRREGVSREAFNFWQARLGAGHESMLPQQAARRREGRAEKKQSFLPVEIVGAAAIDIHLPNGVRLVVPAGNRAALETTLAVVSRLPGTGGREVEPC